MNYMVSYNLTEKLGILFLILHLKIASLVIYLYLFVIVTPGTLIKHIQEHITEEVYFLSLYSSGNF